MSVAVPWLFVSVTWTESDAVALERYAGRRFAELDAFGKTKVNVADAFSTAPPAGASVDVTGGAGRAWEDGPHELSATAKRHRPAKRARTAMTACLPGLTSKKRCSDDRASACPLSLPARRSHSLAENVAYRLVLWKRRGSSGRCRRQRPEAEAYFGWKAGSPNCH